MGAPGPRPMEKHRPRLPGRRAIAPGFSRLQPGGEAFLGVPAPSRVRRSRQPGRRDWVRSPIDAFVLAGLEGRDISPAPPADRRTLIRRATFDLTGLPPTPEEVDAFLADDRPMRSRGSWIACSPRPVTASAGAGTGSTSRATPTPTAWTRTWPTPTPGATATMSIRAFNADMPYDQFVREQIAGDLLARPAIAARPRPADRDRVPRDRAEDARRGRPGEDGDGHRRRAGRHGRARRSWA